MGISSAEKAQECLECPVISGVLEATAERKEKAILELVRREEV